MRVCIRSSSLKGQKAYKLIKNNFDFEIVGYMEEINYINDTSIDGVPVYSQYKIKQMYEEKQLDKIIIPGSLNVYTLFNIQKEIKSLEISEKDLIIIPIELMDRDNITLNEYEKETLFLHKDFNYLPYLEFHVADHCNLNCSNCSHFSSFVSAPCFADYLQVKQDLECLKNLVDNIDTIRILGGECLLNPDLGEYINLTRSVYPYTNLSIVTNGLLIKKLSTELIDLISKYNVKVEITSYRPLWNKMDELANYLKEHGINYRITEPMSYFYKIVDFEHKLRFPYASLSDLPTCMCKNLYKGKVAICPIVCYSKYFDQYNKTEKMESLCEKGMIDIYEIKNYSELKNRIDSPCELCDFCLSYRASRDEKLQEKWRQLEEN